MAPMEGAKDFLDLLRTGFQVIILSDTFYEFAAPMMRQLGQPTLFCHRLIADDQGFVARMKELCAEFEERARASAAATIAAVMSVIEGASR